MTRLVGVLLCLCLMGAAMLRATAHTAVGGFNPDLRGSDMAQFVSMAENQVLGLGMVDASRVAQYNQNPAAYRLQPPAPAERATWYYLNDPGLGTIIWAASNLFGNSVSPGLALLWLQIIVDILNVAVIFWLGRRCAGPALGLICAALYAAYVPGTELAATHPYYYFWTGCLALWSAALVAVLSDAAWTSRPLWRVCLGGMAYGLFVGGASLLRPTFAPLGLLTACFVLVRWRHAWKVALCWGLALLLGQALASAPLAMKSAANFGMLRPPRAMWHMVYIGFGAHANPYGIKWDDSHGLDLAARHQINRDADPVGYERVLHDEVMRIHRAHPWLWPRNAVHNIWYGITMSYPANVFVWPGVANLRLPAAPAGMLLVLILGMAACFRVARQSGDPWTLAFVLLQGLYFATVLGLLIPPYFGYNSAFVPTYIIALGAVVLAASHFLRQVLPKLIDWLTAQPPPSYAVLASGAVAAAMAWLQIPELPGLDVRAAVLLTAPLAAFALRDFLGRWLGPSSYRLAVGLCLVQALSTCILFDMLRGPLNHRLLAPTLPIALGLAAASTLLLSRSAIASGVLLALGSAFQPLFVLLPWMFASLLRPWPEVSRRRMLQAAAAAGVVMVAALASAYYSGGEGLWVAPGFLLLMGLGVDRAPRAIRWSLAALLVVIAFSGFGAWTPMALTLAAVLWHVHRSRQAAAPARTPNLS